MFSRRRRVSVENSVLEVTKVCLVLYADKRQRGGQGTGEGKERGWICKQGLRAGSPHTLHREQTSPGRSICGFRIKRRGPEEVTSGQRGEPVIRR